jgi:phosphoribosyl-AMP cyclohydrolase / phosphoribosyl-ATP pyrophosphohydrolase
MLPEAVARLDWDKGDGLLPAVVQDAATQRVLMLGYMSREALAATLRTQRVTFFSRSRQALWSKGETSGHVLDLVSVHADCDRDALLVLARPRGPTCHLGTTSCFGEAAALAPAKDVLESLDAVIAQRERKRPGGSYTTGLFERGVHHIAQKVGEEGVETALAGVAQDDDALLGESADLVYHTLVLLRARGLGLADLKRTLQARNN